MHMTPLGKVSVTTPGTPVPLTTDQTIYCARIVVSTPLGNTGRTYFGAKAMNKSSYAGVFREINIPSASGTADGTTIDTIGGENLLQLSDFAVDAAVAGEGLLVSYFVR